MNILFLTVSFIDDMSKSGIYTDLLRHFNEQGHSVTVISPIERRYKGKTRYYKSQGVNILQVKTLNIKKTHWLEKGIGTLLLEYQYIKMIKKYLAEIKFDIVLYSTPPITLVKPIQYIKTRDNAISYLMLKDIFPQNAIDLGLFNKSSFFYKFFTKKEKKLYLLSDRIGCMSPANVDYMKKNHPFIENKLELCPNAIEVRDNRIDYNKKEIRREYNIPEECILFIYGGNLGKPQGISFLLEIIESQKENKNVFFLMIGSGTEYNKISIWFSTNKPSNALLLKALEVDEYEKLVYASDVGLIFLDPRFTIPNYPSRLLGYLKYKKPILAATDKNTDVGRIAEQNEYGFSCLNGDIDSVNTIIKFILSNRDLLEKYGQNGYQFLLDNYTVDKVYKSIIKRV